jgi:16S rRNA (cytidine1402-2'-O)-methyltransferase
VGFIFQFPAGLSTFSEPFGPYRVIAMSTLFVVATPIGNLEDMTLRAIRVLGEVGAIVAEDTRTAAVLLRHYEIRAPELISYTEHNRDRRIPLILERLRTADVALVSDAGTPAVSDPGIELAAAARGAGHAVVALPGASAVVAAVSVSGLRVASFRFVGFLPRSKGDLRTVFEEQVSRPEAMVAFESPQRLRTTLGLVRDVLPERRIAVCRELTKLHEETVVGTAAEALAHFDQVRGEIVLVIEGAENAAPKDRAQDEDAIKADVAVMRGAGLTRVQASALLESRWGITRRRAYDLWLQSEDQV